MSGQGEATQGRAGRAALQIEANERQEGLGLAGGRGELNDAAMAPFGLEVQQQLEAIAGQPADRQSPTETVEGRASHEQEGFEGHQRPLELHALGEGGWWLVGHQGS